MCNGYTGHRLEMLHGSWTKVTQGLAIVLVRLRRCIVVRREMHAWPRLSLIGPGLAWSLCPFEQCSNRIYSSSANPTELPGLPIRSIFTSSITRGELISQQSSLSSRILLRKNAKGFEDDRGGNRMEEENRTEKRRKELRAVQFYL